MSTPRINHTATLLNNGKVLIAGGLYLSGGVPTFLNTAELYDPATGGTFIPTTNTMQVARDGHTATLLQDGTVLIVGGDPSGGTSTEIYDPVSNTFVPNSPAATTPGGATATLLDNGMALLTSVGSTSNGTALYDPAAKTFTATGNLNAGRSLDTATLLNNGSVLLTGGIAIPGPASSILVLASAELYPPSTLPPDTPAPANLVSIAVTPQSATLVPGATLQFTAKGTFNINGVMSMQQLSAVTWSSTDVSGTNVAQITNDVTNRGAVLAVAVGTATIKACAGTICGSTNLTVQ